MQLIGQLHNKKIYQVEVPGPSKETLVSFIGTQTFNAADGRVLTSPDERRFWKRSEAEAWLNEVVTA